MVSVGKIEAKTGVFGNLVDILEQQQTIICFTHLSLTNCIVAVSIRGKL